MIQSDLERILGFLLLNLIYVDKYIFDFVSMVTVDNERCDSMSMESKRPSTAAMNNNNNRNHIQKLEVYNEILLRLKESSSDEAKEPGFDDELFAHFNRLPTRYM